jgi:hypothetical protein
MRLKQCRKLRQPLKERPNCRVIFRIADDGINTLLRDYWHTQNLDVRRIGDLHDWHINKIRN